MKQLVSLAILVSSVFTSHAFAAEVNVYSARKEALIKPVLDKFSEQTGIEVNLITGKADALISRMQTEGQFSPADVLLTTDVGRLERAKTAGLTQPFDSTVAKNALAENLRDGAGHWFALTMRARPIMYSPERVDVSELSTIEALVDKEWKGRICIRSSSNIYNQSMVAAMIEQLGSEKTQQWANQFAKNFARPPKGGDRDQIKAVAAGQCDIAIANTYYLAGMHSADEASQAAAKQVKVFWPNQKGRGAHVNISGIAIAKNSPNLDAAQKLVEFMLTPESQAWYAETNHEYPVLKGVSWSDVLNGFGKFKAEQIPLAKVGQLNAEALKLMDKAGWK